MMISRIRRGMGMLWSTERIVLVIAHEVTGTWNGGRILVV